MSLKSGLHIKFTSRCATLIFSWYYGERIKDLGLREYRIRFRWLPSIKVFVSRHDTNIIDAYLFETMGKMVTCEEYLDYVKPHRDMAEVINNA